MKYTKYLEQHDIQRHENGYLELGDSDELVAVHPYRTTNLTPYDDNNAKRPVFINGVLRTRLRIALQSSNLEFWLWEYHQKRIDNFVTYIIGSKKRTDDSKNVALRVHDGAIVVANPLDVVPRNPNLPY